MVVLDPARLLDYFTSIDEKLDRLNRGIDRLVRALERLQAPQPARPAAPRQAGQPPAPPRISVQPPQVYVQVEAPEVQRVLALPAKVNLLDAWVQQVSTDVAEIQLAPADILYMVPLDDDIWWSPKRFQSPSRGALYLAQGTALMLPQPGWGKIYARADSSQTRLAIGLLTLVR